MTDLQILTVVAVIVFTVAVLALTVYYGAQALMNLDTRPAAARDDLDAFAAIRDMPDPTPARAPFPHPDGRPA